MTRSRYLQFIMSRTVLLTHTKIFSVCTSFVVSFLRLLFPIFPGFVWINDNDLTPQFQG